MKLIDLFIGGFPLLALFYHTTHLVFNFKYHFHLIAKILVGLLFSKFLKNIFRVKREKAVKRDRLYKLRLLMHKIGTNYSFPSTHVLFYASYFLETLTVFSVLFVSVACFGRVYYKHHVVKDVVFGVLFGLLFNAIFRRVFMNFFVV